MSSIKRRYYRSKLRFYARKKDLNEIKKIITNSGGIKYSEDLMYKISDEAINELREAQPSPFPANQSCLYSKEFYNELLTLLSQMAYEGHHLPHHLKDRPKARPLIVL